MSIFNIFNGQLSEVIEWKNQEPDILWYKYPSTRDEIKNASKLILAPGQGCVVVYEGKVANILTEAGTYNIKTDNHPFFTTLTKLRQNFDSEHKVYIYFYRTGQVVNQNWGTSNPIKYVDSQYQIPVELGANGVFDYVIADVAFFYQNIVTNKDTYTSAELKEVIVNKIPQEIATLLASTKYSFAEVDSHLNEIGGQLKNLLNSDFAALGLSIVDFKILGTQFDSKTKERIGGIADIVSESQAAKAGGLSFVELEKLRALRDAAKNEGGLSGIGAQLGAGVEIAKLFSNEKDQRVDAATSDDDVLHRLQKLQLLLKENVITQEEFDALKKQILDKI